MDISNSNPKNAISLNQLKAMEKNETDPLEDAESPEPNTQADNSRESTRLGRVSETNSGTASEPQKDSVKDRARQDLARASLRQIGHEAFPVPADKSVRPTTESAVEPENGTARDANYKPKIKMIDL